MNLDHSVGVVCESPGTDGSGGDPCVSHLGLRTHVGFC